MNKSKSLLKHDADLATNFPHIECNLNFIGNPMLHKAGNKVTKYSQKIDIWV